MKHYKAISDVRGFTLVELMITLLISGIVILVISYSYTNQRKIQKRQEAVVDMQQNARAGLYLISQEMRMAGYDPLDVAGAQILPGAGVSDHQNIQYTQDLNEDGDTGDTNENITLNYDAASRRITRDTGGGAGVQPFLNNVDAFQLVYLDEDDNLISTPISAASAGDIRAVQISMLIRSSIQEPELFNNLTYDLPQPAAVPTPPLPNPPYTNPLGPFNDSFRRRLVAVTIQCRNASL